MDRRRLAARRLLRGAALVLSLVLACDSPFEPQGEGERIPIGLVIEQDVTTDSARFYSFTTSPGAAYAVFFQSLAGNVWLRIIDSVSASTVANLNATPEPGNPRLEDNAVASFGSQTQRVFRVIVQTFSSGTARFRFKIYQVNTDPELVPVPIEIGDTVAGETIDPSVDLDRFVLTGTGGQEVVLVGETPAPVGSGSVSFTLVDTVDQQFLGYVVADAGPPTLTSGRMRLPATRGYVLSVGSVTSNTYPRYGGPYRFWTYLINPAPEHRGATVPFDAEVANERIDRAGDVDEFTFQGTAGSWYNVFLQAPRAFQAQVVAPNGVSLATVTSVPSDTTLFGHSTGSYWLAQSGTYTIRVMGGTPTQIADTGAYRFYVYAINPLPEHVAATITPGDTIAGETIERPGDIDDFTFSATAGDEFNAFLQTLSGSPDAVMQLDVAQKSVQSNAGDTDLLRQATGRFALPVTTSYQLRVTSAVASIARDTGAYRFLLYRVDPLPETGPATLTLGDTVAQERIDVPGDFDRFTLNVPQATLANIVLWRDSVDADGLQLSLTGAGGAGECSLTVYTNVPAYRNGWGCGTSMIPAGTHVIRIEGGDSRGNGYRSFYRLETHAISRLAEITPDSLVVGDTVSGDAIDPLGDIDAFYFRARAADHVDVLFQAMGTPDPTYGLWLSVLDSTGRGLASSGSRMGGTSLDEFHTDRIDIPADGRYRIQVSGVNDGRLVMEQGPYRFAVKRVPTTIETASSNLVGGDSVGTERIDIPGDVDRFTLTGSAGQELVIRFQAFPETAPLVLAVLDTTTRDTLTTQLSAGFLQSSGRFVLPAAGVAWVRVLEPRFCDTFSGCGLSSYSKVGPYSLKVVTINRAPEVASATVTIGDTISGEAIDPEGDIDDFTFAGTGGRTVQVYFQTPQGVCCFDPLLLEVMDPANNAVLGSVTSKNPTPNLEDQTTGAVVLPRTDQFRVRVRGSSDRYGAGAFRFRIVEMP
jgi:hypothetical protein